MTRPGKDNLYIYKIHFREWYWYLASFIPKEKWLQSRNKKRQIIFAFCKYEGEYCETFFSPMVWRKEIKLLEEISSLEVLVLFGLSLETLKGKIRKSKRK